MNGHDDEHFDEIDERPMVAIDFFNVVKIQDRIIAAAERRGKPIAHEIRERMRYVEGVLLHGNCSGRSNPTITLPQPYSLGDVEAVIGSPDDMDPGSDAAWRAVRRQYDATQGGRQPITGRTRG